MAKDLIPDRQDASKFGKVGERKFSSPRNEGACNRRAPAAAAAGSRFPRGPTETRAFQTLGPFVGARRMSLEDSPETTSRNELIFLTATQGGVRSVAEVRFLALVHDGVESVQLCVELGPKRCPFGRWRTYSPKRNELSSRMMASWSDHGIASAALTSASVACRRSGRPGWHRARPRAARSRLRSGG